MTASPESITSMIASGAQLVVFTTDQGNPYASALAPTIKITANPEAAKLAEQIDFDASDVFQGRRSRAETLPDLLSVVGDIEELHIDAYNHVEAGNHVKYVFAPYSPWLRARSRNPGSWIWSRKIPMWTS